MGNEREQMTTEEIGKLILENYETVAERATRFRAAHPEGVLLPLLATPPELQREEASFVAISYHNQKEYEEACQRILDAYNANPDHWPASALFTEMLAVAMLRPKGWGHAYEAPGLSYVSKTAWTENGETSAMGRCLNLTGRGEGEENYFGNMKASREEMRKNALLRHRPRTNGCRRVVEQWESVRRAHACTNGEDSCCRFFRNDCGS